MPRKRKKKRINRKFAIKMKLLEASFTPVVVFLQIVMEFRTPVDLPLQKLVLTPRNRVLLLGSCFSDEIGRRLAAEMDGGCVLINPFGTFYNPTSILQALRALQTNRLPEGHLFKGRDGRWRSWAFGRYPSRMRSENKTSVAAIRSFLATSRYRIYYLRHEPRLSFEGRWAQRGQLP